LSAIRYLDLGIDEKQSTRNAILALVAASLIICVVVWLQEGARSCGQSGFGNALAAIEWAGQKVSIGCHVYMDAMLCSV
jgi:hypothetical protein